MLSGRKHPRRDGRIDVTSKPLKILCFKVTSKLTTQPRVYFCV